MGNVEVPVEVPMVMTCEAVTQVPVENRQIVPKQIPKVMTEVVNQMQQVPQVLIEEQLVERTQVQVCEVIRQVQKPMVQQTQRTIPRVTTQVVEKVQAVPAVLINEVVQEVPQVQTVEVLRQTAQCSTQRIVQQSNQYEQPVLREQVVQRVEQATIGGVYQAGVVGVRENVSVQPTVVERVSPILTNNLAGASMIQGQQLGVAQSFAAATYATTLGAGQYGAGQVYGGAIAAPTTYMGGQAMGGQVVMEAISAPTTFASMAAPTTFAASTLAAPTYA